MNYSRDTVPAEFNIRWYQQPESQHVLTDIALFAVMIVLAGILTWMKAR